jgi:hypothetical protein
MGIGDDQLDAAQPAPCQVALRANNHETQTDREFTLEG